MAESLEAQLRARPNVNPAYAQVRRLDLLTEGPARFGGSSVCFTRLANPASPTSQMRNSTSAS